MVDIKKLKPIGVVMILVFSALVFVMFFVADFGIPKPYTPAHETEYYTQSEQTLRELVQELEQQELPRLPGIVAITPDTAQMRVVVTVTQKESAKVKAVLDRDFGEDSGLFEYIQQEG